MQRKWDCCCKKKVQSKAKHAAVSSGAFKRKHSHALLIALSAPHVVFQSGNPTYHFRTLATNYISKSIVYSCTRSNKRVQIQRSMFVLAYLVLECLTKIFKPVHSATDSNLFVIFYFLIFSYVMLLLHQDTIFGAVFQLSQK